MFRSPLISITLFRCVNLQIQPDSVRPTGEQQVFIFLDFIQLTLVKCRVTIESWAQEKTAPDGKRIVPALRSESVNLKVSLPVCVLSRSRAKI